VQDPVLDSGDVNRVAGRKVRRTDGVPVFPVRQDGARALRARESLHDPRRLTEAAALGVPLVLAGHTHGMQFGVENPYFKWSPVQWFYKEWAGLYENGKQKLYVNRGYGFIGYPGRVGILPEITVIELT
jgi:hypothetical protein